MSLGQSALVLAHNKGLCHPTLVLQRIVALMNEELPITAETKVAALLARYPELEDVLIAMAPPFKKL